jgi:hypothetical protein
MPVASTSTAISPAKRLLVLSLRISSAPFLIAFFLGLDRTPGVASATPAAAIGAASATEKAARPMCSSCPASYDWMPRG